MGETEVEPRDAHRRGAGRDPHRDARPALFLLVGGAAFLALVTLATPAAATPILSVASPGASPSWTNVSDFHFAAFVYPINSTADLNGVPITPDLNGNLSAEVALSEGSNLLTLNAMDWMGENASVTVEVILDTVVPTLTMVAPLNDSLTNRPLYIVRGTAESLTDSVAINGVPVALDGAGDFFLNFTLNDGLNLVFVTETDLAGNTALFRANITFDRYPPFLQVDEPVDGALKNTIWTSVSGRTEPNANVTVNGFPANVSSLDGTFYLDSVPLDDVYDQTVNLLVIRAVDRAGNIAFENRTVIVDTKAPTIALDLDPAIAAKVEAGMPLNITTISVQGQTDSVDAVITIAGQEVTLQGLTFARVLVLREGLNEIQIVSRDAAGNSRVLVLNVTRDTVAPSLGLTTPDSTDFYTNLSTVEITGSTNSADAVVYIAYNDARGVGQVDFVTIVNGSTPAQFLFDYTLVAILDGAPHVVTVTLRDLAGNEQSTSFTYTADFGEPPLQINAFSSVLTDAYVWINGSTEPNITEVTVNGEAHDVLDGYFAVRVQLPPNNGTYTFLVKVVDRAGNEAVVVEHADLALPQSSFTLLIDGRATMDYTAGANTSFSVWLSGGLPPDAAVAWYFDGLLAGVGNPFAMPALPVGEHVVRVTTTNATWTQSYVMTVRGWPAGTPKPITLLVNGQAGASVEASTPVVLSVSPAAGLPSDAALDWYVDDTFAVTAPLLSTSALGEGTHVIRVEAHNATWSDSFSQTIHVGPSRASLAGSSSFSLAVLLGLAGVAAVGAVLGGTQVGRYFVLFAAIGAISNRRKPASPLDHFVRGRLYQVISEEPGIHFSELKRRAAIASGSASHHLHVLDRAGLVRVLVDGTKTRFYPTDRPLDDDSYGLSEADRAVLTAVLSSPGITEGEISQKLERSLSVVSRSVDRLGALGHITTEQRGRAVSVFPREGAAMPPPTVRWPDEMR